MTIQEQRRAMAKANRAYTKHLLHSWPIYIGSINAATSIERGLRWLAVPAWKAARRAAEEARHA